MTDTSYRVFFDELHCDIAPKMYANVVGQMVRIIIEPATAEYQSTFGVKLQNNSRVIMCLKSELPSSWTPRPDAYLKIDDVEFMIYSDSPCQDVSPDGEIIRFIVHPI